ncbi:MAG: aldo/keto reductase [Lautropia sp.]|nr:MAG: aldo/keto reductase [Pseudomonadota bacterium]MBC6958350.1 aldo/keto reductase [Lautropia sp.]MCL4701406.1 aldo/keto reductase [Burkholderiaceae bacterium]MDL1907204.1 aldo/keto reductase [Betaproteobacteria bacterium PRO1]RIK90609.1 MAG: NADP-dependent oxidoreductase [Burkholderiales bacterium]
MKTRRMGHSSLLVSELCLGTMMFGDQTDAGAAADIVALARERGVNFVDTADVYSHGASEAMLGPLLKADRDRWVLASKVGNPMSKAPNASRYSRKWLLEALDASLARLGTDYLDIWYLHRDFDDGGDEEMLHTVSDLIRAGRIRYWGLSNFRGWRIATLCGMAARIGMPGPIACQPYYNLLNRQPEVEILPSCTHHGLGVAAYSPVARGVLTGKYAPGDVAPEGSRAARGDRRILETEWRGESLAIAQKLKTHAEARGIALVQFAVAWLLANRVVSSVIAGPKTVEQFADYFGALDYQWSDEDEARVDSLVTPGHASTPGYHDPQYPFRGRRR